MHINRKHSIIWLILLAFLFQSSIISGSFGAVTTSIAKTNGYTVQICTGSGLQWINLTDQSKLNSPKNISHTHNQCHFCGSLFVYHNSSPVLFDHLSQQINDQYHQINISDNLKNNPFLHPNSQAPPTILI